jgi:2',3'-cyclic-nucleotide 2'-phosphodiesterase (5'-nucleotidase family)
LGKNKKTGVRKMKNKFTLKLLSLLLVILVFASSVVGCFDLPIQTGESSSTTTSNLVDPCEAHLDVDNNGFCDECRFDVVETLDFYNFNDLHGKLNPNDDQPGVSKLTSYLEKAKTTDEHVIILSSGDMWQGSGESNITKGALITEWMNMVGFEAMALGNHEYDWGEEYVERNSQIAEFPLLAINIYSNEDNERVDYCEASVMIERGGAQIGIIGAIGDCYSSILNEMVEDIHFKVGRELTNLVKAESEKLRAEGADMIVYLLHDGASKNNATSAAGYYDTSLSTGGYVDLVFEGHTHRSYIFADGFDVPHLQGGGDNSMGMTHVEVDVNFANGNIDFKATNNVKHSDCSDLYDSSIVDDALEKYAEELSVAFRDLGYNAKYRRSSEIASLVAKLYYEAGVAKWGEEYNIVLGGGSLNLRSPYDIGIGNVKYANLQAVLPFDNEIRLCSIKGSDLIDKFLNNSSYYVYSTISVSQVDPNATYYIVADSWTSAYYWAKCTEIETYDHTTFARDLLAKYIENGGWSK